MADNLRFLAQPTPLDVFGSYQQGQQFAGRKRLADALAGGGEDPMAVYGSYNPEQALAMQQQEKMRSAMAARQDLNAQHDAPILDEMSRIQKEMISIINEKGLTEARKDERYLQLGSELSNLNSRLRSGKKRVTDLFFFDQQAGKAQGYEMAERKQDFTEDKEQYQRTEKDKDDLLLRLKSFVGWSKDQMDKMKVVPQQAAKVRSLIYKPVVTYSEAGAATKIVIQSLDNSAVMGNEISSLSSDGLEQMANRYIGRIGEGSITVEDLRGIHQTMLSVANGYNTYLLRIKNALKNTEKAYSEGIDEFTSESAVSAVADNLIGLKANYPSDFIVEKIIGNPEGFEKGYKKGGSGAYDIVGGSAKKPVWGK